MSVKRQATTDLNHENWDQEEPSEQKDMGQFRAASKDILEKRVIRTAKRRTQVANEPTKSVFSGFGGFNKTQPSSFDFLANLTNGSKTTNGSTGTNNSETSGTSSLFSNKPTGASGGLFGIPATATPSSVTTTLNLTSSFGATVKTSPSTLFSASKADSTVSEMPFKMQSVSSSDDDKTPKSAFPKQPLASNVFGVSSTSANDSKASFSSTNASPFKIQPVSNPTATMMHTSFDLSKTPGAKPNTPEKKGEDKPNEKKMKYYAKLKGLNESVSDWINKHVAQTPLCILSPIFKDYEKYLQDITEEYQSGEKDTSEKKTESNSAIMKNDNAPGINTSTPFGNNNAGTSLFSSSPSNEKPSIFGIKNNAATPDDKPTFSFGIMTSPNTSSNTATSSAGFSFGLTTSTGAISTSSSSVNANTPANQSSSAPFSFGIGKPFSFSSNNVQQLSAPPAATENDEDEPPKVEYTPVKEDNSVYEKKCKIFVKKDNNFADKGVGTLYVKKIEESGKHQLLVRANTNLGTVLLNLVLASAIPTQRMGKNNVMLVCIPTPDSKPPPTPVLIRVETTEEADELLETLNKYKS